MMMNLMVLRMLISATGNRPEAGFPLGLASVHRQASRAVFAGAIPCRFFNPFLRRISMNKIVALRVAAGSLALAAASSFAAIDVTAATTGVTDAQTAVLAVMGVMITMAAAIYGVKKVLALLGR
jgi:protein-L-isoaspartate O-methyltransferase